MNSSCFEVAGAHHAVSRPFACMFIASVMLISAGIVTAAEPGQGATDARAGMDKGITAALLAKSGKPVRVLIEPRNSGAPLPISKSLSSMSRDARLRASHDALSKVARQSQAPIIAWLRAQGIAYRSFTVVNAIAAELTPTQVEALASRDDVRYLADDPIVHNKLAVRSSAKDACTGNNAITYGIDRVNANDVWALGFRGQGVVVAGQDTGYDFDHPALIAQYRGNDGTTVSHAYNWHDSIHALINGGSNTCGLNSAVPCDDSQHGTHTMGTMVGRDEAADRTVGVAPAAKWIGCRNMEAGDGTPSTYLECFDWFLAPTDLSNQNPDPTKAPHVINNSWGCPTEEGCTSENWAQMDTAVNNLTAAGILVVASAGNSGGAGCGSINTPAAMYENALTVAWTTTAANNALSGSSSRGVVTADGSNRIKPDISAPGSSVCSTVPGTGYSSSFSGTSMAGPHVAGVAALLMSAFPELKNDPPRVRDILLQSASPLPQAGSCGGVAGSARPNPFTGWGLVDALAAYQLAESMLPFANSYE